MMNIIKNLKGLRLILSYFDWFGDTNLVLDHKINK